MEAFGDHFGALLPKNGGSEGNRETDLKNRSARNPGPFGPGGVPINLNGRKALRPEKPAGQPWKPTGHTNSAGKQRGGGYPIYPIYPVYPACADLPRFTPIRWQLSAISSAPTIALSPSRADRAGQSQSQRSHTQLTHKRLVAEREARAGIHLHHASEATSFYSRASTLFTPYTPMPFGGANELLPRGPGADRGSGSEKTRKSGKAKSIARG